MAVVVLGTDADDRDARPDGVQKGGRRGGSTPVVRHLEEIDARLRRGDRTRREQRGVHVLFGVAHQQEATGAEPHVEDDRDVVDAAPGLGRRLRHGAGPRPECADCDAIEEEAAAGGHPLRRSALPGQLIGERLPARAGAAHPGRRDPGDPVPPQQQGRPAHVVLVGVRQQEQVQPPIPWRDPVIELSQQAVRIGTGVDQDPSAGRPLEQDRVALAHIEHGEVEPSVGAARQDHDEGRTGSGDQQGESVEDAGMGVGRSSAARGSRTGGRGAGARGTGGSRTGGSRTGARHADETRRGKEPTGPLAHAPAGRAQHGERRGGGEQPRRGRVEGDAGTGHGGRDAGDGDQGSQDDRAGRADDRTADLGCAERDEPSRGQCCGGGGHDRDDQRRCHEVGQRRHERDPPEVEQDERQRGGLRCERDAQRVDEPARRPQPSARRDDPFLEPRGQARAPREQPSRGGHGELEPGIADHVGIDGQHGHDG